MPTIRANGPVRGPSRANNLLHMLYGPIQKLVLLVHCGSKRTRYERVDLAFVTGG